MNFWEMFSHYYESVAFEPSMLIQNAVNAACIVILFAEFKKSLKKSLLLVSETILLWLLLTVLNGFTMSFTITYFNWSWMSAGALLVLVVLTSAYAAFFCKNKTVSKVLTTLAFCSCQYALTEFSGVIPRLMENLAYGGIIEIFVRNFFVICTLGLAVYIRRYNMEKVQIVPRMGAMFLIVFDIVTLVIVLSGDVMIDEALVFTALAFAGLVVLNMLSYFMVYRIGMDHNLNMELMAESIARKSDEDMMQLNRRNIESMREIRHELKNQYAYMKIMLQNQDYEGLQNYFAEVEESVVEPLSQVDCGNRNISAILNLEASKAHAQGVEMNVKAYVPPALPFTDGDMCSLITNLADNAIEACCRYGADKNVSVSVFLAQCYLYISVENPVDLCESKEKLLSLKTSKKDAVFHGYGSKIVDRIVNKYNGQINRSVKDGKFTVDVMLDLMWSSFDQMEKPKEKEYVS